MSAPPKTTDPTTPPNQETTSCLRYLIVDDDVRNRELLLDILSSYGDCDIAVDGRDAVDAFRQALESGRPYHAVLLDIMMPNMNGQEALEQIRQIEEEHGIFCLSGTKVIMTTALRESLQVFKAFRNGCEAYLVKPIEEEELIAKLRELTTASDTLAVGT